MTREQIYKAQLKELGVYEDAFDPEIKTLASLERDLTRAKKEWSATAAAGAKPSLLDPLYGVIVGLRREILAHREALGLTPKALRKLRGPSASGSSDEDPITAALNRIVKRVSAYDAPALPVSNSDTSADE